ncbi:MAG: hypothetical protein V2B15_14490 [Bacteroidota bacterium]
MIKDKCFTEEWLEQFKKLNKVIETSHFKEWKLDEHRSYQPGVPKAHYKFSFDAKQQGSGTILLDVLIEDSTYPAQVEMPVNTKWIETEAETMVIVPTIDAITGDKREYRIVCVNAFI